MKPKPDCKFCRGTGTVTDWVDYGSTRVPMETPCDCVTADYPEVERCSACKENAGFTMDGEHEWRSECCGAKAIAADPPETGFAEMGRSDVDYPEMGRGPQ